MIWAGLLGAILRWACGQFLAIAEEGLLCAQNACECGPTLWAYEAIQPGTITDEGIDSGAAEPHVRLVLAGPGGLPPFCFAPARLPHGSNKYASNASRWLLSNHDLYSNSGVAAACSRHKQPLLTTCRRADVLRGVSLSVGALCPNTLIPTRSTTLCRL